MFKPVAMQRVELSLLKEHASEAALLLADLACFDPEVSEVTAADLPELPGEGYRQVFAECRSRLDKILLHYGLPDSEGPVSPTQPVSLAKLAELDEWLRTLWDTCSEDQEQMRKLRDDHRRTAQMLKALGQFMDLNIDLTLLQKNSRVLDIRVGTLPRANAQRFAEALGMAGYVAIDFFTGPEQVHLIIAGTTGRSAEVERVLQAAGWRMTDIPTEFRGRPAEVRQELIQRMARLEQQQAELQRSTDAAQSQLRDRLLDAGQQLARAAPFAELAVLMRGRGNLVMVSGWIPKGRAAQLHAMLEHRFGDRFVLHARDPIPQEHMRVPSLISHHRWLRPFASLVLNYGVPRYDEIDPTVLFALSYVLMFGMMFGDVGQGATIALAGALLRRRLGQYAALAVAAGISSAFFGLLYGSVFGFEQLLPALWMPPLSDPLRMLGVALGWGIGFIVLATALTIRNRIAAGRMREALLDSHGAAGLSLYLGLVFAGYRYATAGTFGIATLLLVCSSLGMIIAHSWQHSSGAATWERILIALMEGFETVMGYVSNTLSFLRLAAFSLNHVALTIAIFTIGSMMHATGYWVSVVLGNIFILLLEGGIVAIQTLRLEYYEGFSRFFSGDGRAFRPLTLGGKREWAS
ncbi:hypothetical protein MIZ01_1191 [Sideroxyarcus emersonii]|uniref:V-type ATP synthase subunit I n=1 Tax=Sideroxyarcus emersonii TaxID=2764705 RepID=A0AAN2BYU0_9PROT|nr:V-type ATPase 116kDa subunit family protein [Sideroxyarcus emersonii]BCK87413.1 hypothetical protein MIZ01_1191 [Sideroxyarcus emersonii]